MMCTNFAEIIVHVQADQAWNKLHIDKITIPAIVRTCVVNNNLLCLIYISKSYTIAAF